jgi:hypothetical protein
MQSGKGFWPQPTEGRRLTAEQLSTACKLTRMKSDYARYQLIAKATYLPKGYLVAIATYLPKGHRTKLWFRLRLRYQLIAGATYLRLCLRLR